MSVVPVVIAVTNPVVLTEAMAGAVDTHEQLAVTFSVEPSEKDAVTVNC
jgi:hypothetical protein